MNNKEIQCQTPSIEEESYFVPDGNETLTPIDLSARKRGGTRKAIRVGKKLILKNYEH